MHVKATKQEIFIATNKCASKNINGNGESVYIFTNVDENAHRHF